MNIVNIINHLTNEFLLQVEISKVLEELDSTYSRLILKKIPILEILRKSTEYAKLFSEKLRQRKLSYVPLNVRGRGNLYSTKVRFGLPWIKNRTVMVQTNSGSGYRNIEMTFMEIKTMMKHLRKIFETTFS